MLSDRGLRFRLISPPCMGGTGKLYAIDAVVKLGDVKGDMMLLGDVMLERLSPPLS